MAEKKKPEKPKDHLGEILGVPALVENTSLVKLNQSAQFEDETTKNAGKDYNYARENIHTLIDTGNELLDNMATIAKQGQQPRAFEVAAGIMKTLLDANKQLLDLSKSMQSIEQKEPEADKAIVKNTTITNNNLHLTTAEMQEYLENKPKK